MIRHNDPHQDQTMIIDFTIGGEEIPLSLNADTDQIITDSPPGLLTLGKLLKEKEVHHYYLTDDFKIFLDEGKGISWAAEITERFAEEVRPQPGEHHVFVPGDVTVYHARIIASPTTINVTQEQIIEFSEALNIIASDPTACMIKRSGTLAGQFDEHQIETLPNLPVETDPDETDYLLHYGVNQSQILAAPILLALVSTTLLLTPLLVRTVTDRLSPTPPPPTPPSISRSTVDRDLMAVSELMQRHAVLNLHGLNHFLIEPGQGRFNLTARGVLSEGSTLHRLQELNLARKGQFSFDGNQWTMEFTDNRYREAPPRPPQDLYNQLDYWRLTSARHNVNLTFMQQETLHDARRYSLALGFSAPLPPQLRTLATDLNSQGLYAETRTIELTPGSGGQTWSTLSFTITITGTLP